MVLAFISSLLIFTFRLSQTPFYNLHSEVKKEIESLSDLGIWIENDKTEFYDPIKKKKIKKIFFNNGDFWLISPKQRKVKARFHKDNQTKEKVYILVEILDITQPLFFNDVTTFNGEEKKLLKKITNISLIKLKVPRILSKIKKK